MSQRDWRLFGRLHTRLYKRLGGRFVDSVGLGRKVLLLTTTGRKSGKPRTTPLVYMPHGNDFIIYPSNGGKESPPAWWLNLQTTPDEHAQLWPKAESYNPHWRNYAKTITRLEGHSPSP
jgi:hypothetical protein